MPEEPQTNESEASPTPAGPSITPGTETSPPASAPPVVTPGSAPEESFPSAQSVVMKTSRRGRKFGLFLLAIILIAAVVVALLYTTKPHSKSIVAVKKDIPYLTYGFTDTGDVTPTYPTETFDTVNTALVDSQLFEGLVRYEDQTKTVPALATSWTNPNDSTWVFNLRHGVKFHSGRTMTAADVKYSLDYAVANQSNNDSQTSLALASSINTVDVISPYQIKITTSGPDPVLLNRLAYLYVLDSTAKLGDPNAGTGPYVVKPDTVKPNATTLDLVAFDNYWGGHVYTRAIHFQEDATEDQMAKDTAAGKLDIAGDFSSSELAEIKSAQPQYKSIIIPDLGTDYLQYNTEKTSSPLHTLAARQAAAYALDVPSILKAGGINATQASQLIPPSIPGYDPSIHNTSFSSAKAKQLLASVPSASTPLTLNYPTGDDTQVGAIAKELDAVGFNVKLAALGLDDLTNAITSGSGDMFYLSYDTNTLDGLDIINNTIAGTPNYTNPELDSLSKQANATLDPATRIATLQKIEQLVASDVPATALFTTTRTYTMTKPYVVKVDLPAVDTGIYFWQVYQK